jgi:hypothetical protein
MIKYLIISKQKLALLLSSTKVFTFGCFNPKGMLTSEPPVVDNACLPCRGQRSPSSHTDKLKLRDAISTDNHDPDTLWFPFSFVHRVFKEMCFRRKKKLRQKN